MRKVRNFTACRTVLATAVLAAFAPAHADEAADAAALTKPDTASISLGAGFLSPSDRNTRSFFSQYNGMRKDSGVLLLDFDYVHRNDNTGMWSVLRGRNLGLDTREIDFTLQRQGDWRVSGGYNEIVRNDPRVANTALTGAGTTTPTILRLAAPSAGSELTFQTKRQILSLSGDAWVNSRFQFEVSLKNEDKDGTRRWGRGYDCATAVCSTTQSATNQKWAVLMLPEPINWNTKQAEAKLNFHTDKLFVSAGYYGSFFSNANGSLNPTVPNALNGPTIANTTGAPVTLSAAAAGGLSLQNVLQSPMALQPDNQAHQFYVAGNYTFTPKVRSTFKLAYTHATQNESFTGMGLPGAPAGRSDLGGVLDTTLAQFGITAKPLPKLSLLANVRYENKDDKTPLAKYNVESAQGARSPWNNSHISNNKLGGKVEASYLLPANIRATAGIDYDRVKRELPPVDVFVNGISGLREKTEELTYRGELRRSLSETVTGSIGVAHARRTGSDWFKTAASTATLTYGTLYPESAIWQRAATFPAMLTDRTRDKLKGSVDWTPTEKLALTFVGETGYDRYTPPSTIGGLRDGRNWLYSVDASYAISEKWKLAAYGSYGRQAMRIMQGNQGYIGDISDQNTAFGLTLTGKPTGVLEVGGGIAYIQDINHYGLGIDTGGTAPTAANVAQTAIGVPDVTFREARLNLFGKYTVDKHSDVRLDLVHVVTKLNEWQWGGNGMPLFTYQDNTTVLLNPNQHVTFIGMRYIYRF